MRDYVILVDSASEMTTEKRKEFGVDYIQMKIAYDGKEYPASLDWDAYSAKELYGWLRDGKRVTTMQVPPEDYRQAFAVYLEKGLDIFYLACSSGLSGSINAAILVAREMEEKYPGSRVAVIDALNAGYCNAHMAIKAAEMKREGKTIEELIEWFEANKLKFNQIGTVETLTYLKRAGRIKGAAAFFGNIFSVKPIVINDARGCNVAIKKIRGRKSSFEEIINMTKELIEDPAGQVVHIGHADCIEDAEYVKSRLLAETGCRDADISYLGPIVGASTGPGTIGVYFFGKEVTVAGE